MRQIKQFTYALEQVLFKKKEGEQQEAQDIIDQYLNELPEEKKSFQDLSLGDTLSTLKNDGDFNADLALIVADLLYEKSNIVDKSQTKKCSMQALLLYQRAMQDPKAAFPLQATQKISELKNKLDASDLDMVKAQLD